MVLFWCALKGNHKTAQLIINCLLEHEMDGEAIVAALASCPGSECLKDVLPKPYGTRLKVYNALKTFCEQSQVI